MSDEIGRVKLKLADIKRKQAFISEHVSLLYKVQ